MFSMLRQATLIAIVKFSDHRTILDQNNWRERRGQSLFITIDVSKYIVQDFPITILQSFGVQALNFQ